MPVRIEQEFTPVVATRGRRVHAITLDSPNRTACGRVFSGWKVSPKKLNCRVCKLEILKSREKPRAET